MILLRRHLEEIKSKNISISITEGINSSSIVIRGIIDLEILDLLNKFKDGLTEYFQYVTIQNDGHVIDSIDEVVNSVTLVPIEIVFKLVRGSLRKWLVFDISKFHKAIKDSPQAILYELDSIKRDSSEMVIHCCEVVGTIRSPLITITDDENYNSVLSIPIAQTLAMIPDNKIERFPIALSPLDLHFSKSEGISSPLLEILLLFNILQSLVIVSLFVLRIEKDQDRFVFNIYTKNNNCNPVKVDMFEHKMNHDDLFSIYNWVFSSENYYDRKSIASLTISQTIDQYDNLEHVNRESLISMIDSHSLYLKENLSIYLKLRADVESYLRDTLIKIHENEEGVLSKLQNTIFTSIVYLMSAVLIDNLSNTVVNGTRLISDQYFMIFLLVATMNFGYIYLAYETAKSFNTDFSNFKTTLAKIYGLVLRKDDLKVIDLSNLDDELKNSKTRIDKITAMACFILTSIVVIVTLINYPELWERFVIKINSFNVKQN